MHHYGMNIHRLRTQKGISQQQLAEALGVHQTHVSAIERGTKNPSLPFAREIATYFEVTLDDLITTPASTSEEVSLEVEPCLA